MVIFAPAIHPATHPGGPLGTLGFSHIGPPITYPHSFHARKLSELSGMDHPPPSQPLPIPPQLPRSHPPTPRLLWGVLSPSPRFPLISPLLPSPSSGTGGWPGFRHFRVVSSSFARGVSGFVRFRLVLSSFIPPSPRPSVPPSLRLSVESCFLT